MENDQVVRQENHEDIDQSMTDYEDQVVDSYKEQITLENFKTFFGTAKDMRKTGDLDEALLLLKALIEKGSELYNSELNINLADIYFYLGDAWMEKIDSQDAELVDAPMNIGGNTEEEQQQMILNDIVQNIGQQNFNVANEAIIEEEEDQIQEQTKETPEESIPQEVNDDLAIQEASKEEPAVNQHNEEQNNEQEEEELEELQIAWENIETARSIITMYLNEQQNLNQKDKVIFLKKLAQCYIRLGDCENRKEAFDNGLNEYASSLKTLEMVEDMGKSRLVAEVYFLLGNTYLYRFNKGDIKSALDNYIKSLEIIKVNLNETKNLTDSESIALNTELKDISYNLEQKIEELEDEIATTAEDDLDKEKIKAIAGNKQDFPKSLFDTNQKVKKIGSFGQKREAPQDNEEQKETKKINTGEQDKDN